MRSSKESMQSEERARDRTWKTPVFQRVLTQSKITRDKSIVQWSQVYWPIAMRKTTHQRKNEVSYQTQRNRDSSYRIWERGGIRWNLNEAIFWWLKAKQNCVWTAQWTQGPVSLETIKLRQMWNICLEIPYLSLCTWVVNPVLLLIWLLQARVSFLLI